MSADTTNAQSNQFQVRFLELLQLHTKSGVASWSQSRRDPGFVYCLIGHDLIVFEVKGELAEPVHTAEKISGVVCKCRNATYLWLEGLDGWDELVALLRAAPDDCAAFVNMRRNAQSFPVQALEAMVSA